MKYFIFIYLSAFTFELNALLDLDKMEESFILETKRLHILGFPDAFNPAIVRWKDRILMCFRSRDPSTHLTNLVGFTWLDNDFNPIGKPQLLELENEAIQDPRLVVVNGRLFMPYSDLLEDPETKIEKRTMCVAEIHHDGVRFIATHREGLHDFEGDKSNKFEKNWVPFDYQGLLLLSYSISPHKVFLPLLGESKCITFSQSSESNSWDWGTLRGGTPALQIDNYYLSFFHSTITIPTVQSNGKSMQHYFMGAYIFETTPPFSIQKISPCPIVHKDFYNGETHPTWKPLRVIFPCGYVFDKNYIWVSYGRQDFEAWIVKFEKGELLKSLISFDPILD